MIKELKPAVIFLLLLTLIGGVVYPLAITGVAQLVAHRASGSFIERNGVVVGSKLVGQQFTSDKYFWGRPSVVNYNAAAATNLSPATPEYAAMVAGRVKAIHTHDASVPLDLVTASASGLDPHISPDAALYQISRVAKARNMDVNALTVLVNQHIQGKWLGIFGQPRVNALELNLALDDTK